MQFDVNVLCGPINGHKKVSFSFICADFGDVNMNKSNRIIFELFFSRTASSSFGKTFRPFLIRHRCKLDRLSSGICSFKAIYTSSRGNLETRRNSQIICCWVSDKALFGCLGPERLSSTLAAFFHFKTVLTFRLNRFANFGALSKESCISFLMRGVVLALPCSKLPINESPLVLYRLHHKT